MGYYGVFLYDGVSSKRQNIHRLVAKEFLSPVSGKSKVNHKDTNKLNNRADNLEWCTQRENISHAIKRGTNKQGVPNNSCSLPVVQLTKDGKFVQEFPSQMEAFRKTVIYDSSICSCLKGRHKTAGGFKWEYKKEA